MTNWSIVSAIEKLDLPKLAGKDLSFSEEALARGCSKVRVLSIENDVRRKAEGIPRLGQIGIVCRRLLTVRRRGGCRGRVGFVGVLPESSFLDWFGFDVDEEEVVNVDGWRG